ncbi:MAG: hypothetical protein KF721_04855 [Ignavibacteriaceae bacterium]|nr:hypothetical protein [Ignavibacteriaceae bacterium]
MTESTNNIQRLKAVAAEAKANLKKLNILSRNAIQLIRSKLDLLQLDEQDNVSALDIEGAFFEMKQLLELKEQIESKQERLNIAEKEISKIKRLLNDEE